MIFENVFKKTDTFLNLPSSSYLPIASSPLYSTISLPMAQHKPVNLQVQAHSTNSHRNFPRIFKTQRLQKIILFRQHHFSTCVIYIIIVAIIFMNSTISGHWYLSRQVPRLTSEVSWEWVVGTWLGIRLLGQLKITLYVQIHIIMNGSQLLLGLRKDQSKWYFCVQKVIDTGSMRA